MTFVLRQIVEEVHVQYSELTNTNICAEFGNLEKAKHADTPRIVWTLTGGTFGDSTKIGGPDGGMAKALPTFWIWLWFDDLEECWNAMVNMCASIRRVMFAPPPPATETNSDPPAPKRFRLVKFDCPSEIEGRHMDKGEVIVMTVELSSEIRLDGTRPASEVELQSHQSTITEDNGILDPDSGEFTAFETAIVTGPPTP
jgi:hypothetical protein